MKISEIIQEATMSQDTPMGKIPGIDQYTPASGDFTMTKSNRMPPGEMPPGATPYPHAPKELFVYQGKVFRLETGYQLSKDSPMLKPGWFRNYNTDTLGNQRGSYQVVDVNPVTAKTSLPAGGNTEEIDRVQQALGRDMKLSGSWGYKGATVTLWYLPNGGKDEKWDDLTQMVNSSASPQAWASSFKPAGYGVRTADSFNRTNSLGNVLCSSVGLTRGGQRWHFAAGAQKIAFKTAQGNSMSVIDTTFFGPESVWRAGGQDAWLQVLQAVQLAAGVQPLSASQL